MALTKKVMILFDPEKYKKLEMKARLNKKSVGALIRDTIEDTVIMDDGKSKRNRMEAARKIVSVDEKPVEWDEIEKLIARGHVE
jgi:urease gamma subunit